MILPSRFRPLLALVALTTLSLRAQEPAPVVTLEEAVARALQANFDVKIQRFSTQNARDEIIAADATFDPTLNLSASTSQDQSPDTPATDTNGNPILNPGSRSDFVSTRAGVSQRVSTGATISASALLSSSERTPAATSLNPAYNADVTLSVRQPLLRGAGSTVNRAALERARIGLDRAHLDFKTTVLTVVRDVEAAYYNLVFAREQVAVRLFSLELAERLFEENGAKRDTGVATDLDVLQSEVGVANARRNLLLARQAARDREDALLALLGAASAAELGAVELKEPEVPAVSFEHSYRLTRENFPATASSEALIEQLRIEAASARRNRLPDLSVNAALGLDSRQDSYANATNEVWSGDGYSWQVDLALSVPWGLRAERARYRQALTNLGREEARLLQLEQDILVQVRGAVRAVETNTESVAISALATELSERQFEVEKARYDAGLSIFRSVQEAQEALDAARVNELQARVNLRIALANLARLEGSSLAQFNIALAE